MKRPRQIVIADHLWDALERMAREMGSDREVLVNQALHAFARQNGFIVPAAPATPAPPPLPGATPSRSAAAEQVLEAAARLEQEMQPRTPAPDAGPPEQERTPVEIPAPAGLLLVREDGTPLEVSKDRFVIGRGRSCDLVIDSAKVSREHAAIVRDADGWSIEDLGSSNGTWHHRERVTRKRIADGDEFYICSEKIRCVLR